MSVLVVLLLTASSTAALGMARSASVAHAARGRLASRDPQRSSIRPVVDRAASILLARRQAGVLERSLPDALDDVARSLRSGGSLRQAIGEAAAGAQGALADDLGRVTRDAADGVPLGDALARWSTDRPLPGVRLATAALSLAAETGGASARAVDGVAATLRTNLAIAGEVRALSSQARLSALVIVLAPLAFTGLAVSTDPRTAGFLLGTPFGLVCVAAGLGLDGAGWLWMRRITSVTA